MELKELHVHYSLERAWPVDEDQPSRLPEDGGQKKKGGGWGAASIALHTCEPPAKVRRGCLLSVTKPEITFNSIGNGSSSISGR